MKSHIPANLRAERARANLTIEKLSELAGVSPQTISGIENGHNSPTTKTVERLARALGIPAGRLIDSIEAIAA